MHSTELKNRGHTDTLEPKGKPMAKDKFQDSKERWKRENMKIYTFRLSLVSEKEMVNFLSKKGSVYAYIKGLIRKDMESQSD